MENEICIVKLPPSNNTDASNLSLAIKQWRRAILFGIAWSAFLSLHTIAKLNWLGWQDLHSIFNLAILIFAGTFAGGALGWFMSIWLGAHRIAPKRLAISFVLILLFTVGTTALLFALQYRLYYSQWHMPAFSIGWFFQVFFTGLSAFYLFAVQGLRILLPFAPLGLAIAAVVFVKTSQNTNRD